LRFLIDVLHPAHAHFFHHFIAAAEEAGHQVLVTARKKEMATDLLSAYGHPHLVLSSMGRKKTDLVWELLLRNRALAEAVHWFRPDAMLGIMGISIASVGKRLRIPSYVFYDTENATVSNWLTFPRATEVITPRCYQKKVKGNHLTYAGYHELAYLHPARFTPDPAIRRALGLSEGERFALVRFVSWGASHDFFQRGFSQEGKRRLVTLLQARRRVFISAEGPLPPDLEPLRLSLPPILIHHAIAAADLLVGESATMASEAAVLGVPALFCSPVGRGYTDEEESRYGLVRNARREPQAFRAVEEILERCDTPRARAEWAQARARLLADNVDVTAWMLDHLGVRAALPGKDRLSPEALAPVAAPPGPVARAVPV
jgi:predicted glycosyltransferase